MIRNTVLSWGAPARFFHWAMAALVLAQIALGWAAVSWRLSPLKLNLFVWHKSIGMVILVLVLVRILWRLLNIAPALPDGTPPWERRAARCSHALLYLVMIVLPVTGWVVSSASGIPFRIFRLVPLPAIMGPDKAAAELAATAHFWLFVFLAVLLLVHVAAALRHHFIKRNDVLTRMLFGAGAGK